MKLARYFPSCWWGGVEPFYGGFLDGAVHALDLSVDPRGLNLGELVLTQELVI